MQRVNVSLLCLLSLSLAGSVFAQQAADPAGVASLQNYSGGASFGSGSYLNIRHMSGDGVGYHGGYSQFGVFTPFWLNDDAFIAADARLMVTNNNQVGGNVGGVARQYLSGLDRIVGAYGYFDTDQSSLSYRYNQASFGLETLGQWWDLRGNGYIALGKNDNFVSNGAALCVAGNPYFGGNNILFAGQQAQYREQSLSGGDFEFGVPVSPATPWLRAYAGAYAYTSSQVPPIASDNPVYNHTIKTPVGARVRLDAWISNDLLLGINATTDAVWGTNVNFMADWRFSGFGPTRYFPQFTTRERMLAPVQRNWRVAVDQYVTAVRHDVVAVNPSTGKPYFITFIDNLKTPTPGGGTGTFEDPYNSFNHPNGIPQANIILVEKGTSTATNPYLGSMTLFDNQRLLGQGAITEKLALSATYGNCTIDSVFNLPTTGSGANHPFVQSDTGLPPVTLANNNEVAGFTIVDQNGNVIGGDPSNINIHDVTILRSTNTSPAINITNLTGNNNIIKNINISTPGGIGNNEGGGIYLQSGVGGANLTMTNVFMNSAAPYTPGGQQPFGIWLNAPAAGPAPNGGGAFTATLTNVHTDGNVVGLRLTENGQNMNVTLNNVTASNNSGRGIEVSGIGGQVTLTANTAGSPLVASGNGGNNLNVNMYSGGNFTGTFANAVFNNSTGGSGVLVNEIGGTATLNLTGTQMNNNQLDGLGLTTSGGGTINVTGSNDQFVGNSRNGIYNVANANATITETFTGSTLLNGNHVDGVYYNLTSGSSLTGTYTGAMVNNNLTSAFYGLQNNSTANLTISNTQATGSGKDGFFLSASNGSSFTGTLQNDTFSNSGANGMLVTLNGSPSSTGTFNLSSTHVDGNATNGVAFTANNQSLYTLSAVNSTFNGNKSSGITGSVLTGSTANVSTSATSSISGNTENGVYVTSATGSNFVGAFDNTAINNNTNGGGINLYLSASPASTLSLTGTTSLNQNGTNGLRVTALDGTVFTPTLSGTSIQQNGQDGVKLNVLSGSSIGTVANTGSFTNVLIRDNKLNGVESVVSGVGSVSDLVFTNAQITNTSGIAPQQIGYLYTVTGGGQLTASFGGSTRLANEAKNAINGTVVGTGAAASSQATITLTGASAASPLAAGGNGQTNSILNVSGGGQANFFATNTDFSNSVAGSGMVVIVNGVNSTANVGLDSVKLNGNANATNGVGFSGTVNSAAPGVGQTGGSLNVCLDNSSLSNNALQGISVIANGAGATASLGLGQYNVANTASTVNFNGHEGVLGNAINGGTINFREIGTTFNNNGTAVTSDGVYLGANAGNINTLFFGGSSNLNTGNGVRIGPILPAASSNGSNLTLNMGNGFSASNNGLYGLSMDGTGANSANVIQDPTTASIVLTGNGSGSETLNFSNANQVLLQLLGSFNGSAGDGTPNLTFNNINTAIVSINGQGTGTIDGNAGNGVYVKMVDVTNAAVAINGYKSISNNGLDGVHIEMIGVNKTINGAIEIAGIPQTLTTMSGNKQDAVNIQLTKTNLVDPFNSLPGVNLTVLSPTNVTNLPLTGDASFNACIPNPHVLAAGANGVLPSKALRIDSLNATGVASPTGGNGGIQITGTNATIVHDNSFITNNTVTGFKNGGGIGVNLTNTLTPSAAAIADNLIIDHNTVKNNSGDGIAFTVTHPAGGANSDIIAKNLQITNNTVTGNTGFGILDSITNNASALSVQVQGAQITGNTVSGNTKGGILDIITNTAAANVTADSQFLNGNTVSNNLGDGIAFTLTNSAAGKTISANNLQFNSNTVTGNTGFGILENITNSAAALSLQASGTQIRSNTVNSNKAGGIMDAITNTVATTTVADNRQISFNTVNANVGFGIKESVINLTGKTTTANGLSISNNTVTGNTLGQGILSTLGGGSAVTANNVLFYGDTTTGNAQNGLALLWTNVTGSGLNFNSSNSSNNLAANGLLLNLTNSSLSNVTLNSSVWSGNKTNGLYTLLNASSITTISGLNMTVNSNKQNGLDVVATNASSLTGGTFTNATITGNTLDGVHLDAIDGTKSTFGTAANPLVFTTSSISNNKSDGVDVSLAAKSIANMRFNTVTLGNTSGKAPQQNGLLYDIAATGGVFNATFTGGTIKNNAVDAIHGTILGTSIANQSSSTISLSGTTADGSGSTGALFTLNKASLLNFTMTNASSISGSGADGVLINAKDASTRVVGTFANSSINNNGASTTGNGLTGNFDNDATALLNFTTMQIKNSAVGGTQQDGVMLNVNQNTVAANTDVVANFTSNTDLSNNAFSALEGNITGVAGGPNPTKGAHITFNHVTANNSGANGVALNVDTRGLATFDATNSSISGNILNGMYINATGLNTLVAVNLTDSVINNNGTVGFPGDGLNGTAASGATLNICADTTGVAPMSFSGNTGNGLDLIAGGVGSRIDLDLHQVAVGLDASTGLLGNGLSGVTFQSLDGGILNLRSNISHFDGNGTSGVGDGITGVVSTSTTANTIGRLLLIGGTADGNAGDGINLSASNAGGAPKVTLTAQFVPDAGATPLSASNNGGHGLSFVASGTGVDANLLMTGGGTFTGNTNGPVFVSANGIDNAIIGLSGTFDGSTNGYGVQVDLSSISGLGLVSIQGPGTVDNNALGGIEVTLNTVTNGGVFIGGFSSVSNNGTAAATPGDGISVTMNNVTTGAVRIDSKTLSNPANVMNVDGNGRNGVNVLVNNGTTLDGTVFQNNLGSHLVDLISPVGATLPCPTPLPNPLLNLVAPPINATTALGIPSFNKNPLVITNLDLGVNGPGNGTLGTGNGILLVVDGNTPPGPTTTIVGTPTNNPFTIANNKIYNTASTLGASNQDGLQVQLLNGADVTGLNIVSNDIETNNGDGVHVILGGGDPLDPMNTNTAATLLTMNISSNTILGNTGTIGVSGNGIQLDVNDAPVLRTITVDANDVENNKGDGFQMLNPNTGVNLAVGFTHDKFIGNGSIVPPSASTTYPAGAMGIDIVLNNQNAIINTIRILSDAAGANTISSNASYGLFLQATNQARYNLNVTGTGPVKNLFDSNTDAGIGIVAGSFVNPDNSLDPSKFSIGNILINDVTVQNTKTGSHPTLPSYPFAGDGIGILTQQYAQVASFVIGTGPSGGNVRNTLLTTNQGDGLKITAIENSQFRQTTTNGLGDTAVTPLGQATILIQNVDATNNTNGSGNKISHGIDIIRKDNALLSWDSAANPAAALFIPGNPVSWQAITDTGSFIHLNDVVATGNQGNGLNVSMNNTQFPITRIDIRDTLLNGKSRFDKNLHNGMQFTGIADSITVVNASDTSASDNNLDGILVQTFNRATFGDVLTSVPLGDPTSPTTISSTFNGMTISRNGSATSPGGKNINGNGIEVLANGVQDNGNIDPFNVSSQSAVAISMTGTGVGPGLHARNLFDSNGGDGVHVTTNRFSFTAINLNKIDMRDTQFTQLGGDGIKVSTNDVSTTTLQLTNASIGYPTASSTQTGLSGNGIEVTTENNSTMNLFVGDQSIGSPNPTNAPDVSIYGNKLNGILVKNNGASDYYSQVYDTASRFNGLRGYSAQLTETSLDVHQIDNSVFSDNSMEGIAVIANAALQSGANDFVDVSDVPADPAFANFYNPYHYLNLSTATKAGFVLTNSTVSNNGGTTPYVGASKNVNGLEIDVSTYAYVSADLRNNTFHGNTLDDITTASFQARTGGGAARGFNPDGTIMTAAQGATLLNTPNSQDDVPATGTDRIRLEDTAQLDMRMLHNTGDQIHVSSGGSNNANMGTTNFTGGNTGAVVSDQSGAKFGLGNLQTSIFQVNAFHYDTVNSVTDANHFTGTNLLPLDGIPTGIVQDAVNFPGPTTIGPPPLFTTTVAARDLEAGLVSQDGFYTNPSAMPPLLSSPPATAFTQVRVDDVTPANQSTGTGANGVIAYNGTTGQFTLAGAGATGITVGDTFRVHILDTNTFNQFGVAQNVEAAFANGFQSHSVRLPPGSNALSTTPGTYYTTNPLSAYFDFPSISFPPN